MKFAFIMRGIPGSGKSTVSKELAKKGDGNFWIHDNVMYFGNQEQKTIKSVIHSTDQYHIDLDGKYKFKPENIGYYHQCNKRAFEKSLKAGIEFVICDNTNTTKYEYGSYVKIAQDAGYIVSIVTLPLPDIDTSVARNVHNVPKEAIEKMIKRWEPF